VRRELDGRSDLVSIVRPRSTAGDEPDWVTAERLGAFDHLVRADPFPHRNGSAGLPASVELWVPGDEPPRPVAAAEMFHGPIGEFAQEAAEHSEADPVAVFAQALTLYGVACNRGSYMLAGNDRHGPAIFSLIVGRSAKGAKGTAYAGARELIRRVDPGFLDRILGGFGSGEAVIAELAPDEDGKVADTRLAVMESEFGAVLAKCRRETSTLGQTMRDGWDGRPLSNRTRSNGKLLAVDYHLGAVAHVTRDELLVRVTDADIYGGTMNRWLHFWSERGRLFADGGNIPGDVLDRHATVLRRNLARMRTVGHMKRTEAADELWKAVYAEVAADDPLGVLGHVVSRAAPQMLRLSVLYALADGEAEIDHLHVGAAHAAWRYCRASAALTYGEVTGDVDGDRLLRALREAGADGLDSTAANAVLGRKPGAAERARALLERQGLAVTVVEAVGVGRPRKVMFAVRPRSESFGA
jgi:hypothetical protein